ncbi:DUF2807 domain-containing protein [Luteibacter aegosomaticola]|uniref:DUF4097 family beta strand repeat-containing protein n=1 Tax=Luteibacter aegosomaticola TaxID=2911538 RepID=UPI001FFB9192|nr:DUF4097 family beta strand repeat-containing protein [Luteibacter aegosomaticola]UPG89180.1 DUF2807 domain-containing protein [Luteibacter aegosomaticola]
MRHLILAALLLAPAAAMADEPQCKFHADRNLDLDLAGVRQIRFVVNSHDLKVDGAAGGKPSVQGRACASTQEAADNLVVVQSKEGSTLVVELKDKRDGGWHMGWGSNYAYLKVQASVPGNLPIEVNVGSGDAKVRNVASLESTAGSGDLEVDSVRGTVKANVGSGDVKLSNTGAVEVGSVGSGDLTARNVTGGVRIATVGSGDAKLTDITGDVDVGTIGSGDLDVNGVKGNLTVRTKGSGDVDQTGVTGKVDIPHKRD